MRERLAICLLALALGCTSAEQSGIYMAAEADTMAVPAISMPPALSAPKDAEEALTQLTSLQAQARGVVLAMPPAMMNEAIKRRVALIGMGRERAQLLKETADPSMVLLAFFHEGGMFHDLSQALIDAPVPEGMTVDQLAIYRELLTKKSDEIQATAVSFFGECVAVGHACSKTPECSLTPRATEALRSCEAGRP